MVLITRFFNLFCLFVFPFSLWAQHNGHLRGEVFEEISAEEEIPIIGADVYWVGTTKGTTTDLNGQFSIEKTSSTDLLVISYVGYRVDTFNIARDTFIHVHLEPSVTMDEVQVVHRQKSTEISFLDPLKTEKITEKELLKAACCNLSESFETSPSVDVSFTDAVTGTRQIQMLGLAGTYTQITNESMPDIRGLSSIYGLTYIPGTWIEGIQLNKGAGTVANGFESIAGQINVELRKPESADPLYLNFYASEGGRVEGNANITRRFKDSPWSTTFLLHGQKRFVKHDRNDDGFMDMPLSNQFIGLNRWKYVGENGLMMQFGVKATVVDNTSGQVDFDPKTDALTMNNWGMKLNTQRFEAWSKIGKVFLEKPWKTFGVQMSAVSHNHDSYFGLRAYDANQTSLYGNFLYQSILGNTNHTYRTGVSIQYDDYKEKLAEQDFERTETVPGAYFEYTYKHLDKFNVVAGIRADYHNEYGAFVTPRIHLRYALSDNNVIRASAGRGQRTPNLIAENIGILASSRFFNFFAPGQIFSEFELEPEVAWNFGLNFTQCFKLDYREGTISFDFYRTDFQNQVVVDREQSHSQVLLYNLDGKSYSNSFQVQLDYELIKRLDVRVAYRWFDVKTTYLNEGLMEAPFVAKHRAFINLGYKTRSNWAFDMTLNWQGQKRIPSTESFLPVYQRPEISPDFVVINAQISKNWHDKFEIYLGGENLLNFQQDNPIISSEDPFGEFFDSSLVWGPVFGRNIYFGLRYWIK
ncbi:MAG: TonB-dependent receptor [Bacteroidota bacterium]